MIKATFHIEDMTCSICAMKLESLEDELPGIKRISASYLKAIMVVEFDETLIKPENIIAAVKRKGYSAFLDETHL
jgi:copper chaperone CopZ